MSLFHADTARFEVLAEACEKQVYYTCLGMMGSEQDAQDCAQEALLRAFKAFSRFRREAGFATWVHRIAVNVCLDALRARKNHLSLEALGDAGFDKESGAPTPYARMEALERRRALSEALDRLPGDARALIVLRDMRGLPYEEIARILGLPLGTVKSRVSRARKKLCELLSIDRELFRETSV